MTRVRKIEPAVQTITLATAVAAPGVGVRSIIDISQCASLVNRRFYRQGLNWAVAGIKIVSGQAGQCWTLKLPNTWVLANAWKKSFATWNRMNSEALSESDSVRPRFLDFKIYMDNNHHLAGFGANLLPLATGPVAGVPFTNFAHSAEWESSKMVIPVGTPSPGATGDRELIAIGPNYPGLGASGLDAVSMVEGYAASRGLPNVLDPNAPDDAADVDGFNPANWMAATFNQGTDQTEDVLEDMISENNIAPYPFENGLDTMVLLPSGAPNPNFGLPFTDTMYPGGANQLDGLQNHDITNIYSTSATTNTGIAHVKGGNFPCGLIAIDWIPTESSSNLLIQIDLIPGSHRGYLAEPMQDM